jgi:hypothetical protein
MANIDAQDGLHGERASGRIKAGLMEKRREVSPPFQPVVPRGMYTSSIIALQSTLTVWFVGSIILRDLRLWHAGMPNRTDNPRVMLAQIRE